MIPLTNIRITSLRPEYFVATAVAGTHMQAPGKPCMVVIHDPVIEKGEGFKKNRCYKITAAKMPDTHELVLDCVNDVQADGVLYVFREQG